jgi:hypothetical protein
LAIALIKTRYILVIGDCAERSTKAIALFSAPKAIASALTAKRRSLWLQMFLLWLRFTAY